MGHDRLKLPTKINVFVVASAAVLVASLGFADQSTVSSVDVPCLSSASNQNSGQNGPRLDVQSCSVVLRTPSAESARRTSTGQVAKGILDLVEGFYRYKVSCMYHQVEVTGNTAPLNVDLNNASQCVGINLRQSNVPPAIICNIADNEDNQNYLSESCGLPRDGSWEYSHIRGVKAQAIKFYRKKVIDEVESSKKLTITTGCQEQAKDYKKLNDEAKNLSDTILAGAGITAIPQEVYTNKINFCSTDNMADPNGNSTLEDKINQLGIDSNKYKGILSLPKASSCMMNASRSMRETLFGYLVQCEINARIDQFYVDVLENSLSSRIKEAAQYCMDHASGIDAFKSCYDKKVKQVFKDVNNQYFGNTRISSTLPASPRWTTKLGFPAKSMDSEGDLKTWLFAFAGITRVLRGKKAVKKRQAMDKESKKTSSLLTLWGRMTGLVVFTLFASGSDCTNKTCVGDHDKNDASSYTARLAKACCDPGNDDEMKPEFNNPTDQATQTQCMTCMGVAPDVFTSCPAPPGASPSPDPKPAQVAANAGTIHSNISDYYSGGSQTRVAPSSSPLSNAGMTLSNGTSSGALDGGIQKSLPKGAVTDLSAQVGSPTSNIKAQGGSIQGGSIGGGGNGTGALSQLSGNSEFNTATGLVSSGALVGTGGYLGGAGGPAGRGSGGSGGFRNDVAVGDGENKGVEFGAKSAADDGIHALGTADPENYFTRINLDQNLFKIVHDRYQNKAGGWILQK
jgi:hypothetical protein